MNLCHYNLSKSKGQNIMHMHIHSPQFYNFTPYKLDWSSITATSSYSWLLTFVKWGWMRNCKSWWRIPRSHFSTHFIHYQCFRTNWLKWFQQLYVYLSSGLFKCWLSKHLWLCKNHIPVYCCQVCGEVSPEHKLWTLFSLLLHSW